MNKLLASQYRGAGKATGEAGIARSRPKFRFLDPDGIGQALHTNV
jgi:hypothetical protein